MFDRLCKILLAIMVMLAFQSCMGTALTRLSKDNIVGAYPYSAVARDGIIIKESIARPVDHGGGFFLVGLFSMPLDIAFDTILLPFDLLAWPMGYKKSWSVME
jgi:uncharacterized protein YceK